MKAFIDRRRAAWDAKTWTPAVDARLVSPMNERRSGKRINSFFAIAATIDRTLLLAIRGSLTMFKDGNTGELREVIIILYKITGI